MKSLILILLIVGLILITTGYTRNHKNCPATKIEYRYIPRNFYEEQVTETNLKRPTVICLINLTLGQDIQ